MQILTADRNTKLKTVLFAGAEFYDGNGPAPTIDPRGYNASEKMTKEPGIEFTGRITKLDRDKNKVTIALGWDNKEYKPVSPLGELYFCGDAVRDFTLEFSALDVKVQYLGSNGEELMAKLLNICLENPAPKLAINTEFGIVRGVYRGFEDGQFKIQTVDDMLCDVTEKRACELLPLAKLGESYLISVVKQKSDLPGG